MSLTLGALEEIILLLVLKQKESYGAELVRLYKDQLYKEITLPAVVVVLKRLEKKGFLKSHVGEPTEERGGRRKIMYEATKSGYQVIEETMVVKNSIWEMVSKIS